MQNGTVLLVDDNSDMLLIGQRIFSRAGYTFLSARTGAEGIERAKLENPDVIILDYLLQDMNGIEFLRELNANPVLKNIPVIILTARADHVEDLQECYEKGALAILHKPFGHRELVNIIENIIRLSSVKTTLVQPLPTQSTPSVSDHDTLLEIRAAATTVATLCRQLESQNQTNLTIEQKLDLEAVYNSSKRLLNLVKNLNLISPRKNESFFA